MSSKRKFVTLEGLFATLCVFGFAAAVMIGVIEVNNNYLQNDELDKNNLLKTESLKDKKELTVKNQLKQNVEEVENIIMDIYAENKETKSKKEILEIAGAALRNKNFDNKEGYFYLDKSYGHQQLKISDTDEFNIVNFKSKNADLLLNEIISKIRMQKESYFKAANYGKNNKKIAFLKYIQELDIVIGVNSVY